MEKTNKYYNIIANLVKQHKKYPGNEAILDDIIDDVYSHSEVIINSINNDSVIIAYLEKVISTSIITVPKKMGFHKDIPHKIISAEPVNEAPAVNKALVDQMINSSEKGNVSENNTNNLTYTDTTFSDALSHIGLNEEGETVSEASQNTVSAFEEESTDSLTIETDREYTDNIEDLPIDTESDSLETSNDMPPLQIDNFEEFSDNEETLDIIEEQPDNFAVLEENNDILETQENEIVDAQTDNFAVLEENNDILETQENEIVDAQTDNFAVLEENNDILETQDIIEPLLEDNNLDLSSTLDISAENNEIEELQLSGETEDLVVINPDSEQDFNMTASSDLTEFTEDLPLEDEKNVSDNIETHSYRNLDYSKFSYTPQNLDEDFDIEKLVSELQDLNNKKPELNILKIYNLKYKENRSVADIASLLGMSKDNIVEALSEIVAII